MNSDYDKFSKIVSSDSELEGRSVLDVLSGQQSRTRTQTRTHILLNGQPIESGSQLTHLISYVNANGVLCPDLSVRHTLWFHWMLTGKRSSSARPQIDQLLHDINLHALRHTSVRHLNSSELVRLRLAIALLLDPPILLIDLSTCHHDMAETIFILQYVRQWTRANGK